MNGKPQAFTMSDSLPLIGRVQIDGKSFRLGARKFHLKGITYGPFAPNRSGEMFPEPENAARDLKLIQRLGANVLRLYYSPPRWFLDLLVEHGLKALIDIPWSKHLCFLDSEALQHDAREAVRRAVANGKGHPAVFAYSVVNEISPDIARWSGVSRVEWFIDELVREGKAIDPGALCTFTSFPPTEFLQPREIDFHCFNVYLHHRPSFEGYLARLQMLADNKPLVLGEFGMDSIREGETHKCEFLKWQIETCFRNGLAGCVVFSFTDDWFRGGLQIEDWAFGLTTRAREPKESFEVVRRQFQIAPHFPLPNTPKVSVVVATFNGSRTLSNCLEALGRLNYANYEVILVDDGSTDRTPEIAKQFPAVRYIRQDNQGLSAARNAGIRAATGEIVAFTDDDCRADEDWLYYLVTDLIKGDFAAIGGHNFLPPEDSPVAAAVMVSPGGPAHVMVTDREAEHVPGCNMAFHKWALEQIGLFDPIFRKAGDDVDVCWRLQDSGLKIGFSHAGFVWHYRRSTVKAYLKQQAGYGEAEALLIGKHPEHYNELGGGIWRGRIYSSFSGLLLSPSLIYHGVFASGFFQRVYAASPASLLMYCNSLGYHLAINLPLLLLSAYWDFFLPVAIVSFVAPIATCVIAAVQAPLPRQKCHWWSRPLVALLFFLQPIVRGWARLQGRFSFLASPTPHTTPASYTPGAPTSGATITFWSDGSCDRLQLLQSVVGTLERAGWTIKTDSGWTSHDVEVFAHLWTKLKLTTASEDLELGRRNFRCRIKRAWSLPAQLLMLCALVAVALVTTTFAGELPWIWMSLLLLPVVLWIIEDQAAYETGLLLNSLRDVAVEKKLAEITTPTT